MTKFRKEIVMAKNKNNATSSSKTNASSSNKSNAGSSSKNSAGGSMKDSHSQVPDKGPGKSGPGGE